MLPRSQELSIAAQFYFWREQPPLELQGLSSAAPSLRAAGGCSLGQTTAQALMKLLVSLVYMNGKNSFGAFNLLTINTLVKKNSDNEGSSTQFILVSILSVEKRRGENPALEHECNMKKPSAESQV